MRNRISLVLTLWLCAEILVFTLLVDAIGLFNTVLVGLATSLLGATLLKKAGRDALVHLRQNARPGGIGLIAGNVALEDTLAVVAALLLLLPGVLTDVIGLVLTLRPARGMLSRFVTGGGFRVLRGKPRAQHGPSVIDLDPDDWRPADEPRSPLPKA